MIQTLFLIALGGALGSVARFIFVVATAQLISWFPLGVMLANVLGSFAIGVLFVVIAGTRTLLSPFLIVGFLGGFTTFSTYALDTLRLWEAGHVGAASFYALGSVVLSLAAVGAGVACARAWL